MKKHLSYFVNLYSIKYFNIGHRELLWGYKVLNSALDRAFKKEQYLVYGLIGIFALFSLFLPLTTPMKCPEIPAFVAICGISIFWATLQTSILLFNQSKLTDDTPVTFLASIYLFISLCALARMLTLPGIFFFNDVLNEDSQTAAYIWIIWYGFFPLGIICYSLQMRGIGRLSMHHAVLVFRLTPLITISLISLFAFFDLSLPPLIHKNDYSSSLFIDYLVLFLNCVALLSLIFIDNAQKVRRDLWLILAVMIHALDVIYGFLGEARYSVGWYLALIYNVLSSSIILMVLIYHLVNVARIMHQDNNSLLDVSETDSVTGIANRRKFDKVLSSLWETASSQDHTICLLFIDIDHFKSYNDCFGHLRGDDCLKLVAAELNSISKRKGDLFARIGGEEFAFIIYNADDVACLRIAEEARSRVEQLQISAPYSPHSVVTISIGKSIGHPRSDNYLDLMQKADKALYQAKVQGRNQIYSFCSPFAVI